MNNLPFKFSHGEFLKFPNSKAILIYNPQGFSTKLFPNKIACVYL
ncbi:unnamed protein product [marine sediment metagenome]|uniref:Uncharacterized protein n=1 Tax=marine sediment metagenome TaxID=412755 RepID=X1ES51_9ZZZZ